MADLPPQAMPMSVEDHPAKSPNMQRAKSVLGSQLNKNNAYFTMAQQGDEALTVSDHVRR